MNNSDNRSFLRRIIKKLNTDLKLVVLKQHNFEKTFSLNFTSLKLMILVLSILILTIGGTISILSFTSLKSYIPGCIDLRIRQDLIKYMIKVDELNEKANANEDYIDSIKIAMGGKTSSPSSINKKPNDTTLLKERALAIKKLNQPLGKEEDSLRKFIEEREKESKLIYTHRNASTINDYAFKRPANGRVVEKYSLANNKLSVGLKLSSDESVYAILDGIIINISQENKDNHTIIMQHDNNIISIYKNCPKVLKQVGNYVSTGDIIAKNISNKMGRDSILRFQLWYNGSSINPSEFIKFNEN